MTNAILRAVWCANVSVAVVAYGMGSAFWGGLNAGMALMVAGVLVTRRAARR